MSSSTGELTVVKCTLRAGTSGLTGSSMPTTQMQMRSFNMSFSASQSGSPASAGKSLYATQIVLSPSQAIGSITFRTISSRSFSLNARGWPWLSKMREHLEEQMESSVLAAPSARHFWTFFLIWSLTSSGWSPKLLYCTCGTRHQRSWALCSLTSERSWRYKLYKVFLQESLLWLAGSPSSDPVPNPVKHIRSCCPRVGEALLLSQEAENKHSLNTMWGGRGKTRAEWFIFVFPRYLSSFASRQVKWFTGDQLRRVLRAWLNLPYPWTLGFE